MSEILDVNDAPYSDKNGEYGGLSGLKDGLLINNERYLVKYPKNATYLARHEEMSYTNDPVSEFLGSKIYEILGYPVHETMLVERRGKIAVACKDFLKDGERLVEIRTLKNAANERLAEELERDFSSTNSSHVINFAETLLHLKHNELLQIEGLQERFFDMIVIDAFINNSDRNNGNWGIIRKPGEPDKLAPVFDNGGAFNGKTPDNRLKKMIEQNQIKNNVLNGTSIFGENDKNYLVRDLLTFDIEWLQYAVIKNTKLIRENIEVIHDLIDTVPDVACSKTRKEFYHKTLEARIEYILQPAFDLALASIKEKYPELLEDEEKDGEFDEDIDEDIDDFDIGE